MRCGALQVLLRIGEAAAPHSDAIAALLQDSNASVRCGALQILLRIGEAAAPHSDAIAAFLQDSDDNIRCGALATLGSIGEAAAPHSDAIAALLQDSDASVRSFALDALGRIGEAATPHSDAIAALLQDPDADTRRLALAILCDIGQAAAPHSDAIAALLQDSDADVRRGALAILCRIGEAAARHYVAIAAFLQDEDADTRRSALAILARILQDADASVRCGAVQILDRIGEAAAPHSAAIAAFLQDPDAGVRCGALQVLDRIGEAATPHSDAIAALLQDSDGYVVRSALAALRNIGEAAVRAQADAIAALLLFPTPPVVSASAIVYASFGVDLILSALEALGSIGKAATAYASTIADFLHLTTEVHLPTSAANVRCASLRALDAISAAAAYAGDIEALLQDPNEDVRCEALKALGNISVAASRAATFVALSQGPGTRVQIVALRIIVKHELLGALSEEHETALLQLQFNLKGSDKTKVIRAISQLRKLKASQVSVCQHNQNLSGAGLAVAFDSMKQLTRRRELTAQQLGILVKRCINDNAVEELVLALNMSQVRSVAIFPHLGDLTSALGDPTHDHRAQRSTGTLTSAHHAAMQVHMQAPLVLVHMQAITTRCSRWRAKSHVLALVWKQSLPQLSRDIVVSISNVML